MQEKQKKGIKLAKMNNQSRGITLIALVVTIVVLIILATVSINAVFGENGLIRKAEQAKEVQENATSNEQVGLNSYSEYVKDYLPKPEITEATPVGTEVKKPSTWTSTKVKAISDGNGTAIPLPDGFHYVGGNYNTGLIISDSASDANKGESYAVASTLVGNQFVWIPVANETAITRTDFDTSTGQPTTGLSTNYTEPMNHSGSTNYTGYEGEASEYNTMRTQVLLYGGFYIGRYEAGIDSTDLRTTVTTDETVVCKKGVAPYNCVPWGASVSDISSYVTTTMGIISSNLTKGAVYLAKNKYSSPDSVTSTLTYGCQWDAMCRYIGDSQRTIADSEKTDSPRLTGSLSTDVSKNIYDLAGNCREWTMEAFYKDGRGLRGGFCKGAHPVSYRDCSYPANANYNISFRPSLYIK